MLRFLKSITTGLYVIAATIIIFMIGSLYIPQNLQLFSDINDIPLFKWLSMNSAHFVKTYWIYISISLMALLALNMLVCTVDDVRRRFSLKFLIQRLSPHIIHKAVLIILLGHLISASTGFKKDIPIIIGEEFTFDGSIIKVEDVYFTNLKGEDQPRWRVYLSLREGGLITKYTLEPSRPAFYKYGFYAKSAEKGGKVIIGIINDPGAKWEVIGAIIFVIGSAGLLWTRYRNEKSMI